MVICKSFFVVILLICIMQIYGINDKDGNDSQLCPSCNSSYEDQYTIFSTKNWKFVLNPNQYYLGLSSLVLKDHVSDLTMLKIEQELEFVVLRCCISQALIKVFDAKTVNILYDAANTPVLWLNSLHRHVSWNFIPRHHKCIKIGKVIFSDSGKIQLFDFSKKKLLMIPEQGALYPSRHAKLIMKNISCALKEIFSQNNIHPELYAMQFAV